MKKIGIILLLLLLVGCSKESAVVEFEIDGLSLVDGFIVDGYMMVEKDGLLGLMDMDGKVVLEPVYKDLKLLNDGFAFLQGTDDHKSVMNVASGKVLDEIDGGSIRIVSGFNDGYCVVLSEENDNGYIIDSDFNIMFDTEKYINNYYLGHGLFTRTPMAEKRVYEIVDEKGSAIATLDDRIIFMNGQNVGVSYKNQIFTLWDFEKNAFIKDCEYDQLSYFVDNRALAISINKTTYDIIDGKGSIIKELPYTFEDINVNLIFSFNENLMPINFNDPKNNPAVVINEEGEIVFETKYSVISPFSNGVATVELDGKYGYVDIKGNELVPCEYDFVTNVYNGTCFLRKEDKWFRFETNK